MAYFVTEVYYLGNMWKFYQKHPAVYKTIAAILVVLLLLISQAAFWVHRNLYNSENFTEIATTAVTAPSSRQSISGAIVDKALEDRPIIRGTLGPRLSGVVAGLLDTDVASGLTDRLVEQAQVVLTTPRREPFVIETSGIKNIISSIQTILSRSEEDARINPDEIPDEITILDTNKLPNIYSFGVAILWLGPLSLAIALGLMICWVMRAKPKSAKLLRVRVVSLLVVASGAIALLFGPMFKPPVLSVAENARAQTLLGNIFDAFIAPFNQQAKLLVTLGIIGVIISYLWVPAVTRLSKLELPTRTQTKPKSKRSKK